jgi:tRNA(Ile2)-agmatinylcytidine synthase
MDEAIKETFNNVDKETGQILITPRGPDPVLYGVRGETPESVYNAYQMIVTHEPVERWMIFRTNQGTNTHLEKFYKVSDVKPRYPSIISGNVTEKPSMLIGGHAIFTLHDESGSIDCVAYEPTGSFRDVVANLIIGDEITCAGGIRDLGDKLTLNLERIELIKLVKNIVELNPRCPKCGGPTESMGKSQGLRCKKCGFRDKTLKKIEYEVKRNLSNKCYIPPPRAQRHLTKPEKRYGNEQKLAPHDLFEHWHS